MKVKFPEGWRLPNDYLADDQLVIGHKHYFGDLWKQEHYSPELERLLDKWKLYEDTPCLGGGISSAAALVSPRRVVKVTKELQEAAHAHYLMTLNEKIPHIVRVYDVVRPLENIYMIKCEVLHTRITDLAECLNRHGDRVLRDLGLTYTELKYLFRDSLHSVGLDDSPLTDLGRHNLMFDSQNRPTWFDFGCGVQTSERMQKHAQAVRSMRWCIPDLQKEKMAA